MGNKIYRVKVKHFGTNCELQLSPDSSILNLKEKIHSQFNILPEHQFLICNGKPLQASDTETIKQSRIPNGSKILCCSKERIKPEEARSHSTYLVMAKLEEIEAEAERMDARLTTLVKRRRDLLVKDVPLFQGEKSEEMKKIRFESKKVGEALMQLFESLDCLECSDHNQKLQRKRVATKINSVLDKNDNFI